MNWAGGQQAVMVVACKLLSKRSLLMGRVFSLLITGLQFLSRDLKSKEGEPAALEKCLCLCPGAQDAQARMYRQHKQMADKWQAGITTCIA